MSWTKVVRVDRQIVIPYVEKPPAKVETFLQLACGCRRYTTIEFKPGDDIHCRECP